MAHFSINRLHCIESCIQQKMQEKCMCKCDGQRDIAVRGVMILLLDVACHILTNDITVERLVLNQLDHYKIGIN